MAAPRSRAGTASVEIVVMLPVFLTLLFGVFHLCMGALGKLEANAVARGCAYQFAMNGCSAPSAAVNLCEHATAEKGKKVDDGGQSADAAGVLEKVSDFPLVGPLVEGLFGEMASARTHLEAPSYFGDEPQALEGDLYLVCNTESLSWSERIKQTFCGLVHKLSPNLEVPGC